MRTLPEGPRLWIKTINHKSIRLFRQTLCVQLYQDEMSRLITRIMCFIVTRHDKLFSFLLGRYAIIIYSFCRQVL